VAGARIDFRTLTFSSPRASSSGAYGWLHGEQGNDLEHVILDDVPDRADFFVEGAPTTYIRWHVQIAGQLRIR
jgi:hypothetical protein